jgi:ribosomal protein L11 methyltransferase
MPDAPVIGNAARDEEWLELAVETEPEAVESVSAVFAEYGQGVAIEQVVESSRDGDTVHLPADSPVLVKTYLPLTDPSTAERRAHIEKAIWAFSQLRKVGPLQVRTLREADWANAWKQYFFVHRVGRRTVIVPSWRESEYEPQPDDAVLLLDPGMAFGTGLHPTTRLCLRALEDVPIQPGMRVLDVGAGSGILAIAAARLGASYVEAVEIDPVAASVCQDNVERNGVADVVTVRLGTLQGAPDDPFDVALGNISIATLLELHPLLALQLRPGGLAVLSGVLAERADELWETLRTAGWRPERTDFEQDWVALLARRA